MNYPRRLVWMLVWIGIVSHVTFGQTTEFTYQGSLQNAGTAANGSFDFEFALYDSGGSQIGSIQTRNGVSVANGIFSVNLQFGSSFPGASRFLEIRVRPSSGGAFTTLSPRQAVNSSPYSLKSLIAENANNATTAATAGTFTGNLAGDVTGTQASTTVARLRGRNVAGTQPLGGQVLKFNSTTSQWEPDTDIAGAGGGGGTVTGVIAGTGLTGGGATGNVTVAIASNGVGTAQIADASVTDAKINNVSGSKVTGTVANATFATEANLASTAQNAQNAAQFGGLAPINYLRVDGNGGSLNNLNASSILTGTLANARLGQIANANIADRAVTGLKIGLGAAVRNINSLTDSVNLEAGANITITPSGNTLTFASTGGGNAVLNQTTTQVGSNFTIDGTGTANILNATQFNINGIRVFSTAGTGNFFAGPLAGVNNTSGFDNSFFGEFAGTANTEGSTNSFFGRSSGVFNTTGASNSFFRADSGRSNTSGSSNSFFGLDAGFFNTAGNFNVFNGFAAGRANTTGSFNSFSGISSGSSNTTGTSNSFFGRGAGENNTSGNENTVIGHKADVSSGSLANATAIGANAFVSQSNSLILGAVQGVNGGTGVNVGIGTSTPSARLHIRAATGNVLIGDSGCGPDFNGFGFGASLTCSNYSMLGNGTSTFINRAPGGLIYFRSGNADHAFIRASGEFGLNFLGGAGSTPLCLNAGNEISTCSSSKRYKTDVADYNGGLDLLRRFRPVEFTWTAAEKRDVGFIAEEVAEVEPLLTFKNQKGEIEGVQYAQITTILVNSVKEQQNQIAELKRQIAALMKSICGANSHDEICR